MVIDTSAVIACLLNEPERTAFVEAMASESVKLISVVGLVEASFVILGRRGPVGLTDLQNFLDNAGIERIPVDERQAEAAVEAFRRFGKGRHPARLNIGDCFAYALAKTTGEPLLFKGSDFAQTDIVPAVAEG
jgi:ribonuclease VapC